MARADAVAAVVCAVCLRRDHAGDVLVLYLCAETTACACTLVRSPEFLGDEKLIPPRDRYYYFLIATSVLTIVFVGAVVALYYVHLLLPIITIVCAFILFVFWLTGLIKASIELWGPLGSINDNCVRNVYRSSFWGGKTIDTIARIQQEGMCNLWKTTFAMEMVASFVLLWIILLSWSVMRGARGI